MPIWGCQNAMGNDRFGQVVANNTICVIGLDPHVTGDHVVRHKYSFLPLIFATDQLILKFVLRHSPTVLMASCTLTMSR